MFPILLGATIAVGRIRYRPSWPWWSSYALVAVVGWPILALYYAV